MYHYIDAAKDIVDVFEGGFSDGSIISLALMAFWK
jgi:hypothetical protein